MNLSSVVYPVLLATESEYSSPVFWVDFSLCLLLVLVLSFFMCYKIQRAWVYALYGSFDALFIISLLVPDLKYLPFVALALLAILTIICLFINAGLLREYLAKSLKNNVTSTSKQSKNETYDKEKLITDVITTLKWLSNHKEGALITFEKDTPMEDIMKNGTIINCPFTPEIVETIFYEGSRLHDGAIVIKKDSNIIEAASVYYEPTSTPLMGKVGARHRAAIGISEKTDSVTLIVSEETGRIGIAHGGILDRVPYDQIEKFVRDALS